MAVPISVPVYEKCWGINVIQPATTALVRRLVLDLRAARDALDDCAGASEEAAEYDADANELEEMLDSGKVVVTGFSQECWITLNTTDVRTAKRFRLTQHEPTADDDDGCGAASK
jgi:hypothetical protein